MFLGIVRATKRAGRTVQVHGAAATQRHAPYHRSALRQDNLQKRALNQGSGAQCESPDQSFI